MDLEELKELYKEDCKHRADAWIYWQVAINCEYPLFVDCTDPPTWLSDRKYRRRPSAPTWPKEKSPTGLVKVHVQDLTGQALHWAVSKFLKHPLGSNGKRVRLCGSVKALISALGVTYEFRGSGQPWIAHRYGYNCPARSFDKVEAGLRCIVLSFLEGKREMEVPELFIKKEK